MKRLSTLVAAAAVVAGSTAVDMQAQEMMDRQASRFDLGVYAGGAYTSDWYESRMVSSTAGELTEEGGNDSFGFGFTGAFGANATYWFIPNLGARLHYGYIPSEIPTGEDQEFDDGLPQNNHLYDLSVVFRLPNLPVFSALTSNLYGWVGGGGLTTDIASGDRFDSGDEDVVVCEPGTLARGACLPLEPDAASVGQGVVGIGGDVLSLTNNIGVFAELAAHIYDSPVHVGGGFLSAVDPLRVAPGDPFAVADDRYAVTTRLVAGVKLAFGEFAPPPPPVVPVAPEPLPPPPPVAPAMQPMRVCVVQGGAVTEVDAMFNPATGDTVVMQAGTEQPFSVAYPATGAEYASGQPFFINNEEITVMDTRYVRFGLPRVVTPTDVARVGDFQGVGVFAEAGAATPPQVIYLPVRPGCEFQPYQQAEEVGRVRG